MGKSSQLQLSDIEPVFQLVNECRELWADAQSWQTHLLRGACQLTGTAVGHYNEQRLSRDLRSTQILDETYYGGWRDDTAQAVMLRMYAEHQDRVSFFPRCTVLAGQALVNGESTALRPEIRSDSDWRRSLIFNEYRRPAFVDGFVLSFALNRRTGSLIMLTTNQDISDPPPTPRNAAVLSLLTRHIAPLVGTVLTTHRQHGRHGLSPRLRQTLDRLLAGDSEKQIAMRLALHPTTVHDYIGALYRHFHVGSRGELMAYFLMRQPRPIPPRSDGGAAEGSARQADDISIPAAVL